MPIINYVETALWKVDLKITIKIAIWKLNTDEKAVSKDKEKNETKCNSKRKIKWCNKVFWRKRSIIKFISITTFSNIDYIVGN